MAWVTLIINLVAAVCGSAAVALLYAAQKTRPSVLGTLFARTFLVMVLLVVFNGLEFFFKFAFELEDDRVLFLIMNTVYILILALSGMVLTIARTLVGKEVTNTQKRGFLVGCMIIYTFGIARVLGVGDQNAGVSIDNKYGFFISALFVLSCILFAIATVVIYRKSIQERWKSATFRFLIQLALLTGYALGNETGFWEVRFGIPRTAMSPFALITASLFAIPRTISILTEPRVRANGEPTGGTSHEPRIPLAWDLSDREKEVLLLLISGLDNSAIGEKLFISRNTVKNHAYNIYRKTGAKNRTELVRLLHGLS